MLGARGREHGAQPSRRAEVDGIIKTWIHGYSAIESAETIHLPEQLYLQPSITYLYRGAGFENTRQLSDANQSYGGEKLDRTLWNLDKRSNLADWVQTSFPQRSYAGERLVQLNSNGRSADVSNASDDSWITL